MSNLCCPFCAKEFRAEEILFCDIDPMAQQGAEDPVFERFNKGIIHCPDRKKDENNPFSEAVRLEPRTPYLFHFWHKDGVPEHLAERYHEPLDTTFTSGASFPDKIHIRRIDGLHPRDFFETPAVKASEEAPAPEAAPAVSEEDDDTGVRRARTRRGFGVQQTEVQQTAVSGKRFSDDVTFNLNKKACPRCHCVLPDGFGRVNMHRIVLLGGPASGKTTYMTVAVTHLLQSINMPGGLFVNCTLSEESRRYYDYFNRCLLYNKIESTQMDMTNNLLVAFPLVLNVSAEPQQEGGEKNEYLLVINDCPGEALNHPDYVNNFPAVPQAEGVIFLMDSMQLSDAGIHEDLIHNALGREGKLDQLPTDNRTLQDSAVREAVDRYAYCNNSLANNLNAFARCVEQGDFSSLQAVAMTINKIDLIYGNSDSADSMIAFPIDESVRKSYECLNSHNLAAEHNNGCIDLDYIRRQSIQLTGLACERLTRSNYRSDIATLQKTLGAGDTVATFCTSIHNFDKSSGVFVNRSGLAPRRRSNLDYIGFRLTEPLLYLLAVLGLVRANPQPDFYAPVKETRSEGKKSKGLFGWLFGR